ncbi:hypothetical protein Pat9b_2496 [Pantoea sp. At-9b]|nr:hypothetical protein Pat9b_2496 [Pantoea sp. At-9b]
MGISTNMMEKHIIRGVIYHVLFGDVPCQQNAR